MSETKNKVRMIDTDYITGSRSVNIFHVEQGERDTLNHRETALYEYNYEGNDFTVFDSVIQLSDYLEGKESAKIIFEADNEEAVSKFMETYKVN